MATILEAKDSADWIYRGEGAFNLVLAYCGNFPDFVGKVLRIQKVSNIESESQNGHTVLNKLECLVWREFEDIASAPTRDIANQLYVQKVLCPLLGSEHVDAGIRVITSKEFLVAIERKVHQQRPSWRVDAAKINPSCDSVLLIADHSTFPRVSGGNNEDFCVSVEIKPKGGFLPVSEFIAEENAVKKIISRFTMHQALKFHQGKISKLSKYDPLDMFSGSKVRVRKAIESLFCTPQNNLRVFLNGSLIFGSMGGTSDKTSSMVNQAFQDGIEHVILANDGEHIKYFIDLVSEAVCKSGLLNRLLELQKLDVFDIEGAIHAYYDIASKPCLICEGKGANKLIARYSKMHSLPKEEKIKVVRDYLISATAKDVSVMVTFRARENQDMASPIGSVFLESINQSFDYKVSVVDLDMKPVEKMEYYYELDQQIVNHYCKMIKDKETKDYVEPESPPQDIPIILVV